MIINIAGFVWKSDALRSAGFNTVLVNEHCCILLCGRFKNFKYVKIVGIYQQIRATGGAKRFCR